MTTDIRNLALQLRAWSEPIASGYEVPAAARTLHAAADALEAMAGEVERLTRRLDDALKGDVLQMMRAQTNRAEAAEAERDRLAGEVERLKSQQKADDEHAQKVTEVLSAFITRTEEAESERDRLKAALQDCVDAYDFVIVDEYDRGWSSVSDAIHAARKALGGDA